MSAPDSLQVAEVIADQSEPCLKCSGKGYETELTSTGRTNHTCMWCGGSGSKSVVVFTAQTTGKETSNG